LCLLVPAVCQKRVEEGLGPPQTDSSHEWSQARCKSIYRLDVCA
jgi:hypothetical protein